MDMAFLRGAERLLAQDQPARIDHRILVAALAAQAQATARRLTHAARPSCESRDEEHLVELLLGGPAWREALAAQRGCFSRAEAGRKINGL